MDNKLELKINKIKGIGPKYEQYLNKLGIFTIRDLFYYFPYDYEDRRFFKKLSNINLNEKNLIKIKIITEPKLIRIKNNLSITTVIGQDEDEIIQIQWFNQSYIKRQVLIGKSYYLYGRIKKDIKGLSITNPEFSKKLEEKFGFIYPKYSLTKGITNNFLIKLIKKLFNLYFDDIKDLFRDQIYKEFNLSKRKAVIKNLHFPKTFDSIDKSLEYIEIEKLVLMQLAFEKRKTLLSRSQSNIININKKIYKIIKNLPFELTKSQYKVLKEIIIDMKTHKIMSRLLQGDVGSGKTIVAFLTLINTALEGYQGALMVPTEVLAKQHYNNFRKLFDYLNIQAEVLYSSLKEKEKKEILSKIKNKEILIIIGTHSLIQKDVIFKDLAYVITDEQHRFGVVQRENLIKKGSYPHVLVMSATPIPRTLALILYNDLDISTIESSPPGRKPIKTYIIREKNKSNLYNFLKKEIKNNNQAYIVSPIIEDSDSLKDIKSAEKIFNNFLKVGFSKNEVCLVHGRLDGKDSEKIINSFSQGKCKILISTTVIEVGVDIKNATIMIIINAERFGLAQLHQLRGRVGRGKKQSYCFLVTNSKSEKSLKRLKILTNTNDGFIISKEDLKIRGPGEFLGTNQSGIPEKLMDFNMEIIKKSKNIKEFIKESIKKENIKYIEIENEIQLLYGEKFYLN